jgi:transposase
MRHKTGVDRNQIQLMRSLEEMVDKDSAARQIDEFVENADTSYFERAKVKATGRPPYDPKDLLKLYLYGLENGIFSSRKLERECKRNIELMWMLRELKPESKTICNFRKDNKTHLVRFFREFCLSLKNDGFIDGKLMAIDGTKIRANNGKRNNFSAKKLDRHIEYIDNKIAEYLDNIEKADKLEELQARKEKYLAYKDKIEADEVNEISVTDPDARLMSASNNGVDVAYNVQSVVDGKYKLIAGMDITNNAADQGQLGEVMPKVKEALELDAITVLGDKGYYKTEDFKICEDNGISTIVAKNEKPDLGIYDIDEFTYDEENDVYICPCYAELFPGKTDADGYKEYKNNRACKVCPNKNFCTKGTRRVIKRHIHKASAERNDKRLIENRALYKQRQMLAEHPFGTIKRTMGIRQFATRGKASVKAETALIFTCYNLKRLRVIRADNLKNTRETVAFLPFSVYLLLFATILLQNTQSTPV